MNREAWLTQLIDALRPMFTEAGYEIPAVRVSCSWPSKSIRKRIAECWHSEASADGSRQIFISPVLGTEAEIADIMVHELIHACLPSGTGHKKPFKDAMKALGLVGKATSTHAGEELARRLNGTIKPLGKYPHAVLNLSEQEKKQTTRMLRLCCSECGCIVRTTQKWVNEYDADLWKCPCGGTLEA